MSEITNMLELYDTILENLNNQSHPAWEEIDILCKTHEKLITQGKGYDNLDTPIVKFMRLFSRMAKTNHMLRAKILGYEDGLTKFKEIDLSKIQETLYIKVFGKQTHCQHGVQLKFNNLKVGYKLIGNNSCKECIGEAVKKGQNKQTLEQKQTSREKAKQTMLDRYGVENPMQLGHIKHLVMSAPARTKGTIEYEKARQKSKNTMLDRYGVENAFKSTAIKEKIKQTHLENLGVENPMQNDEIKQRQHTTVLERYNVTDIWELGRNASFDKYGTNVFSLLEFQEKIKQTHLENLGVENPMQSQIIREKAKLTNIERYGTEYPSQSEIIKEKTQKTIIDTYGIHFSNREEYKEKYRTTMLANYGVPHFSMQFMSNETIDILYNKEKFIEIYGSRYDYKVVAEELNIDYTTVLKFRHLYNLDVPRGSSYEHELCEFLKNNGIDVKTHDRKIIYPLELDIVIDSHKLAIEFNGDYWHSDLVVSKDYHKIKYDKCQESGYRLLMIEENEWNNRKEIIKRKILYVLGLIERGNPARKLKIKEIPNKQAIGFCEKYHIQGGVTSIICNYGAFDADNLVAVITIGKQRSSNEIELKRFCTSGKTHAGVFSRLFYAFVKEYNPEKVITFADLRYSEGKLYETTGFVNNGIINPGFKYLLKGKAYHPSSFTKSKIAKKFGIDMTNKTEKQAMDELGCLRIWDCGKIKYVWSK
jgi:hypothetical protein